MRRHSLDPMSLVFGVSFVLIAFAVRFDAPALSLLRLRWGLPVAGVLLGIVLLGSALRGERASHPDIAAAPHEGAGNGAAEDGAA